MKKAAAALLLLLPILCAKIALANTAPIAWDGTPGSEPYPLSGCPIRVSAERLAFDLDARAYGYTLRATVKAAYRLENPTAAPYAMRAVFPFIAGDRTAQDLSHQEVRLNGESLPYTVWEVAQQEGEQPQPLMALSLEEMLKRRKPFTPEKEALFGSPRPLLLLEFEATVPAGEPAELEITARMAAEMQRDPLWTYGTAETRYTFCYFLSPAQYWADFKNLDVTVKTTSAAPILTGGSMPFRPAGWRRYRAKSEELPGGELSFTVKHAFWYAPLRWAACLALIAAALVFWDRRARRRRG